MGGLGGMGCRSRMGGMHGVSSMGVMGGMDGKPTRQWAGMSKRSLECSLDELANGCVKKLKVTSNDRFTQQPVSEIITVKVKPGWKSGTKITFKLKTGDQVQFMIAQKPHKYLKRAGNDLNWICQLSEKQAAKGVPIKGDMNNRGDLVVVFKIPLNVG